MPQFSSLFPADSRAMRSFSKQAYTSGVVIIKCPDCGSRHLIADRLGWFGDSASVETILKEKGQGVRPLLFGRSTFVPACSGCFIVWRAAL
jgi:DNL zinc finger